MSAQDLKNLSIPQFINKPTAAVHIRNGYTATERKLLNICLYEGIKSNFSSDFYTIDVRETLQLLGCDKSKNSAWLKNELFEALRKKPIRWNVFKKDSRLQEWTCSFLAGYIDESGAGRISFQFNPIIVKHFQQRQLYSKLLLQIQAPIKSAYALTLYEFLNDELHRNKVNKKDVLVSLSDLRALFDLEDGQYSEFKHFNNQAIKPALLEINSHTDITVESKQIREKRRVSGLHLKASRRKSFQFALNFTAQPIHETPVADSEEKLSNEAKLLLAYGVAPKKSEYLAKNFTSQQIVANLKYSLQQQEKAKISHFPSFLIKAIEDNYASNKESQAWQKILKDAWSEYRSKQMNKRFDSLTREEQAKLRMSYEKSIKSDSASRIAKRKFEYEGGWHSQFIQFDFRDKVLTKLLSSAEETSFEAFSDWWLKQEIQQLLTDAEKNTDRFLLSA